MVFILIPFVLLSLFLGGAIYLLLKRLKRSKKLYQSIQGELKLQSAKIQELNNELYALSYSVSHDLRAPLRAINGFSRILQKEFSNRLDEEGNEFLSLQDSLSLLTSLEILNLKSNSIDELPKSLASLKSLQELHVGAYSLVKIPDNIKEMEKRGLKIFYESR